MSALRDVPAGRGPARFTRLTQLVRAGVRGREGGLICLAVIVGVGAGLSTIALSRGAALLHELLFGSSSVSALEALANPWLALVPAAGGLLLGVASRAIPRWRRRRPVDPIEANALHGGRMSIGDSLFIGAQTLLSNGFGASVGLEAGYTQLGSGLASRLGRDFNLRRSDMRMMVGAGAAGAIAAAFGAPLTGAFYAFEIIIGTYTPFGLAPVIAASIAAVLVARAIGTGEAFIGQLASDVSIRWDSLVAVGVLSLCCAALGVGVMRGVTLTEQVFRKSRLPAVLQPAVGGVCLGGMALITPHVLSAGHGALARLLHEPPPPLAMLALVLGLKCLASAVSIGSGFRGGLFFASLYLGGLTGMVFHGLASWLTPGLPLDGVTCAVVGMAGMSVTIVGGPLTMTFLALETTGDFTLSIVILAAATLVSVIVRRSFGYSFATWRLHLRGESIRSAQDVGWMRSLTVGNLMRADVETVFADATLETFLAQHPLGTAYWIIAVDPFGRYAGLVSLNEAHALSQDKERLRQPLSGLLRYKTVALTPDMNVKQAATLFERNESEALAVVESATDLSVVGLLSEAHLLRRYTEELDKVRKDLSGETWIDG